MCIITVVDVPSNIVNIKDIKTMTITNSLLGNPDGFGYYLFNNKFSKSKNDALTYWRENFNKFREENSDYFNGIYHVRKSSVNYYSQDNKHLSDEKSHPFIYNDIIVAHNGFLNFRFTHIDSVKYEKFIVGDLIDSQKFAIILSKICNIGHVTFDDIKNALNLFGGAYALAIKGKLDNYMWLVRGKDRTLYQMNIYNGNNIIGTIINTTSFSQLLLGESLLDIDYDYEIKELKENTAYKYHIGSYNLLEVGEIKQDSPYSAKPTTTVIYDKSYSKEDKTVYEEVLSLMYKMGLVISDLIILSEIIFNKPIFILDKEEFDGLKTILSSLSNEAHKHGRMQIWSEILKDRKESVYKLYDDVNIQYPYFMNSKNELKNLFRKSRKEKNANELFALQ